MARQSNEEGGTADVLVAGTHPREPRSRLQSSWEESSVSSPGTAPLCLAAYSTTDTPTSHYPERRSPVTDIGTSLKDIHDGGAVRCRKRQMASSSVFG